MTGAMYSAVAGLKTHMQALNVIGNNIANVNTNGYKAGRYVFQSALYTSLRGGSNGSATVGGKNPSQIGYGTSISSVDINMGTSNYTPTGKPTDCMIDGDGFFLTGGKGMTFETAQDFKSLTLTRVGDIEFKADGYLCKPDGNVVYGFKCLGFADDGVTPVVSNQLQEICKPKITADGQVVYTEEQYYTMRARAIEDAGDALDEDGELAGWPASYDDLSFAMFDSISIEEGTGKVSGIISDTDQNITIGFIAIGTVDNPNGVSQETGTYYRCGDGAGEMYISMLGGAGQQVFDSVNFEFTPRTVMTSEEDGTTYVVPAQWVMRDGVLEGIEAPGENATKAEIDAYNAARIEALSLTHVNGGTTMNAAGEEVPAPDSMILHTGGTTVLITGGLEQTDTDLATEISNMIMIQRGYQANTRIVTVTDSMLEELVNMKR